MYWHLLDLDRWLQRVQGSRDDAGQPGFLETSPPVSIVASDGPGRAAAVLAVLGRARLAPCPAPQAGYRQHPKRVVQLPQCRRDTVPTSV
mmetsp:Transcript_45679/g.114314  ORF Transcript_45679/g.114314 Transcript_45679/m.114314 type:complete len:90 (+) Transcript_45679:469-738(+)